MILNILCCQSILFRFEFQVCNQIDKIINLWYLTRKMKNDFFKSLYTINETVSSVVSVLAFWKAYDIKHGLYKFW